jgi:signal transduction histidine kinase
MEKRMIRSVDFRILLVAVLYYLSAEIGFFLALENHNALPFWPPAGVALALVVLFGRKVWPGIAIGSLVIIVKSPWFGSIDSVQMVMTVVAIITTARVLEPLAGEFLFKRLVKESYPFTKAIYAFHFVLIAFLISWISTGGNLLALSLSGVIPTEDMLSITFAYWIRNVAGILLFSPLLLSLPGISLKKPNIAKIGEIAIFLLGCAGVFFLLRIEAFQYISSFAMAFVAIPFLLWLAFRFKSVVAILGYMAVAMVAIYLTSHGYGPFYMQELTSDTVLLLQIYLFVISISTLVLASAVEERQQAKEDLKKFNENLEAIVQDRTRALEEEIQNRREAQQKLQLTNDELLKRNTELDNFVYSVSHDLRAPIASILGLINLAKSDKKQNLQHLLELMERSAQKQDYFIREILDQSRNARLDVKREPILFKPLIEEAFEQLDYSNLNGKRVEKIITVDQDEPFYCDKWRLKVILNNVISNSIRYKNGKEPVVKVNAKIDRQRVRLSIEDNGTGIEKKHLTNLGKMFYRATDEGAGSGLGLYIVKETIQKLQGSMAIKSERGQGTRVEFEIPEVTLA